MDGSTIDFILIPIVAIISLATWLAATYWADSRPRTNPRTTAICPASLAEPGAVPTRPVTAPAPGQQEPASQGNAPRQATAPAGDAIPAQR
jgi:hypothetical protein